MKSILLSIQSEFYKSRKTAAFWGAIILPFAICTLITFGELLTQKEPYKGPAFMEWIHFLSGTLGIMGTLILPMYIIFAAYSVNNIEHKANAWKSLFALPLSKLGIYAGKYIFAVILVFIMLLGFGLFSYLGGMLSSALRPTMVHYADYNIAPFLIQLECKLLLSSLGILSIQLIFSALWKDFLKPMGIGLMCVITGIILIGAKVKNNFLFPYSHPLLAINTMKMNGQSAAINVNIFSKEIYVSIIVSIVFFILGYIIVSKKSIE